MLPMKTILLIDDDSSILTIFGIALEMEGYAVVTASSGEEGLTQARLHRPDLILSDVNMPGGDGCTLLDRLRREPTLEATQFVLMTGNTKHISLRHGMDLGADDFLLKPFEAETLLRCVATRLRRGEVHARVCEDLLRGLGSTVLNNLPHELFTPLAGILGLVQVLRADFREMPANEVAEDLKTIEESGWRLHRTLKNYLSLVDLELGNAKPASPSVLGLEEVAGLVNSVAELVVKRHGREADLALHCDPPDLRLSPEALSLLVEELLDNAFKFSEPGSPVALSLGREGELRVVDAGRGMTDEQLDALGAFTQFNRQHYEQQGLGLGLALVHKQADRLGTRLVLTSPEAGGVEATIRLPLATEK